VVVLVAWGQSRPPEPTRSASPAERGRAQFGQSCAFCHGPNANGATHGPSLIRSAVVRHDENGNLIVPLIREGRPERGMPAIALSPGQAQDIVAFLKSRIAVADIRSANRSLRSDSDKLLVGNAAMGKAFFEGPGGCTACHSTSGDLAGIADKYPAAVLQSRLLYPQLKQRTATITDSEGKQHSGTLVSLSNYDVAIQDTDGWYHSWPLSAVKVGVKDPLAAHRKLLDRYTDSDMHNMLAFLETLK
jgi:cytochrome c oxidase cbb3-type subunit 3